MHVVQSPAGPDYLATRGSITRLLAFRTALTVAWGRSSSFSHGAAPRRAVCLALGGRVDPRYDHPSVESAHRFHADDLKIDILARLGARRGQRRGKGGLSRGAEHTLLGLQQETVRS